MLTIFLIILAYFLAGFCSAIIAIIISAKNYCSSLEEAFYDNEPGYILTLFIWPAADILILVLAFMALLKKFILLGIRIVSKFYKYKK